MVFRSSFQKTTLSCTACSRCSRERATTSGEELGAAAADYHRRLGAGLRLRDGDRVIAIGTFAHAVEEGMLAAGNGRSQVCVAADIDAIRGPVAEFSGAVFVKGSRRYQLESLFSATPATAGAH